MAAKFSKFGSRFMRRLPQPKGSTKKQNISGLKNTRQGYRPSLMGVLVRRWGGQAFTPRCPTDPNPYEVSRLMFYSTPCFAVIIRSVAPSSAKCRIGQFDDFFPDLGNSSANWPMRRLDPVSTLDIAKRISILATRQITLIS